MKTIIHFAVAVALLLSQTVFASEALPLEQAFQNPTLRGAPADSQLGVFWFWANTVTREGIRRDLEEMQRAGIRRAVLSMTRAHSATVEEGGVVFLTPEWLALFRYALDEAERLGLQVSAVMSNGWYQGAPWVTPELGAQMLVWSETAVTGPAAFQKALAQPGSFRKGKRAGISRQAKGQFKPVATLAFRQNDKGELLKESLVRLDDKLQPDGTLTWPVPEGAWLVLRFAHVPNFIPMKQDSPGFTGLQIDHLRASAIEQFFAKVGVPMLEAAGPHVGKTLDYFHEDSIELGHFDWTGDLPAQFEARRSYDLIPWLPILAGKTFAGLPQASRVDHDFTLTVDELLADEHYGRFRELCHRRGLKLETEGGDVRGSIRVKGMADLPMGEFWNARPNKKDARYVEKSNLLRAFNPNAVFASHLYGAGRVSFEAFTTAQHWMESPATLKPLADEVYCLGANHLTWHGYSYSRPESPKPGDVYFAGTHLNPGVTWWPYAGTFIAYLNRCQSLLQAGLPVADILYVDGPETQDMLQWNGARSSAALYKCDAIPGELLAAQLAVLPGGRVSVSNRASYAVLAVANAAIEPEVIQKISRLVSGGATAWFRTVPRQAPGFTGYPESDRAIASALSELGADGPAGVHAVGKGRVILGDMPVKEALERIGLAPDFAYAADGGQPCLDYAHRRADGADIYFVANWTGAWRRAECAFRVTGKQPELWDPVTGAVVPCPSYRFDKNATRLSLHLPPNGSTFVVFRKEAVASHLPAERAEPPDAGLPLDGPWRIRFSPAREELAAFETNSASLFLWNECADARLKGFAGSASYSTTFMAGPDTGRILDLGAVYDLAEVLVNGQPLDVVWTAPFRVDLSSAVRPGTNTLDIRVVNTWHNWRLLSNYLPVRHDWSSRGLKEPLLPAGLAGPVRLMDREAGAGGQAGGPAVGTGTE